MHTLTHTRSENDERDEKDDHEDDDDEQRECESTEWTDQQGTQRTNLLWGISQPKEWEKRRGRDYGTERNDTLDRYSSSSSNGMNTGVRAY